MEWNFAPLVKVLHIPTKCAEDGSGAFIFLCSCEKIITRLWTSVWLILEPELVHLLSGWQWYGKTIPVVTGWKSVAQGMVCFWVWVPWAVCIGTYPGLSCIRDVPDEEWHRLSDSCPLLCRYCPAGTNHLDMSISSSC